MSCLDLCPPNVKCQISACETTKSSNNPCPMFCKIQVCHRQIVNPTNFEAIFKGQSLSPYPEPIEFTAVRVMFSDYACLPKYTFKAWICRKHLTTVTGGFFPVSLASHMLWILQIVSSDQQGRQLAKEGSAQIHTSTKERAKDACSVSNGFF